MFYMRKNEVVKRLWIGWPKSCILIRMIGKTIFAHELKAKIRKLLPNHHHARPTTSPAVAPTYRIQLFVHGISETDHVISPQVIHGLLLKIVGGSGLRDADPIVKNVVD